MTAAEPRPTEPTSRPTTARPRPAHLEGVIGVPATEGNRIDVLRNGDEIFPAMLEAIERRRAHDRLPHLRLLGGRDRARVRRARWPTGRAAGVRVRVLLDALGARTDRAAAASTLMEDAGVAGALVPAAARLPPGQFNHRTHRKVMIVDEAVGFTGGVGIADEWLGDAANEREWRDTHFRIEGPAVDGLRAAFLDNWAETDPELFDDGVDRFPDQPQPGAAVVQCVRGASETGLERHRHAVPHAAQLAEQRVRIATAYFVPDDELVDRLCEAAERGVEVEILLPGRTPTSGSCSSPARRRYAALLERGRRDLELPAVDAARQGHDRRRDRRQHRLGEPQPPVDGARRGGQRRRARPRPRPRCSTATSTRTSSAACASARPLERPGRLAQRLVEQLVVPARRFF